MKHISTPWYRLPGLLWSSKYPFEMPPATNPDHTASLTELLQEPDGLIKGRKICVWFYEDHNKNIVEVMAAGHSNSLVCGRVSTLIYEALIALDKPELTLWTAGSLWVKLPHPSPENQNLLKKLAEELITEMHRTGLVKVFQIPMSKLDDFRVERAMQFTHFKNLPEPYRFYKNEPPDPNNPVLFNYTSYPLLASVSEHSAQELSFTIPRSLYANSTFEELSKLHEAAFRHFRISDTLRRAEVYGEWLVDDIFELMRLIKKREILKEKSVLGAIGEELWAQNVIPYAGTRDYGVAESQGKVVMEPAFQNVGRCYAAWEQQFTHEPENSVFAAQQLLKAAEAWEKQVFNVMSMFKLTEHSFTHLKNLNMIPGAILAQLEDLKDRTYLGKEQFLRDLEQTIGKLPAMLYASTILAHAARVQLNYGLTSHQERFENAMPHFILQDIHWLMEMIKHLIFDANDEQSAITRIQELFQPMIDRLSMINLPDDIRKAFPDALIGIDEQLLNGLKTDNLDQLWENLRAIFTNSVQKRANLPEQLSIKLSEVFEQFLKIKQDMTTRHKRRQFNHESNEALLIDAMLRGWPSFFLNSKELKEMYDRWVRKVRKKIWWAIRRQLLAQHINMLPLTEDNISYRIVLEGKQVHITPYFGINSDRYGLLCHQNIGTIHYFSPWSYREKHITETETSTLQQLESLLTDWLKAIEHGDVQTASPILASAFKLHPLRTGAAFFTLIQSYLGSEFDPHIDPLTLFQQALRWIWKRESYCKGEKALKEFVTTFSGHIADPYIFLACGEHLYKMQEAEERYYEAIKKYNDYIDEYNKATRKNETTKLVAGLIPFSHGKGLRSRLEQEDKIGHSNNIIPKLEKRLSNKTAIEILIIAENVLGKLKVSSDILNNISATKYRMLLTLNSCFHRALDEELNFLSKEIEDLQGFKLTQRSLDVLSKELGGLYN